MIRIHLSLILFQFVWLIQTAYSSDKPLIFNPHTLEIYDYGDTLMTYKSGPYAAACPADEKHEHDFNEQFSLNNKALFVRHYSNVNDDKIFEIRCKSSVELAAAYYTDPRINQQYLKFGYEIYFVESRYATSGEDDEAPFKGTSLYSNFEKILKPASKRFMDFIFGTPVETLLLHESENTYPLEMGFIWISKTTLQLINSKWRMHSLAYSIHKKVDWPATKCDDYKLPDELHTNWPVDEFYSPQNQENIFNSVQLLEGDCESETYCVQKYTLLPAYQLLTNDLKPASCTNFATVPIWSKTAAPLLDYLDKFLFTIAEVAENKLTIYSKVIDTLTLSTLNGARSESKFMYLNPNQKKLAIPRLILKLVIYKTQDCDINETLCWFHAVIIIHNEPSVTQKLCEEDKCEQLGWASIQYQDKNKPGEKSQHIYCCEMNENLEEILLGLTTESFKYKNLDLKEFPRYNKLTYNIDYEDKQKLIEDKMNEWIEGEGSSNQQNSWTPLPPTESVKYLYS